jgi:hypothetical protein
MRGILLLVAGALGAWAGGAAWRNEQYSSAIGDAKPT